MPRTLMPVLIAALMLSVMTGCASGNFAMSQSALESFNAALRALPGVDGSSLDDPPADEVVRVDLTVDLAEGVTDEELVAIGQHAADFSSLDVGAGRIAGRIELRLAGSAYSYFDVATPELLDQQLAYWRSLTEVGFESVSTRTYSPPVSAGMVDKTESESAWRGPGEAAMPSGSATESPSLGGVGLGRLTVVELSSDETGDAELASTLLAEARGLPDPGAPLGEWDVMGLSPFTTGQFEQAGVPSVEQVAFVRDVARPFQDVEQLASVHVRVDDGVERAVQVNVTAFNGAMEDLRPDDVQGEFRETPEWAKLVDLSQELQAAGGDFSINYVGNNLVGAGVFELKFGVDDCVFWSGGAWPELSNELRQRWAAGVQGGDLARSASEICSATR